MWGIREVVTSMGRTQDRTQRLLSCDALPRARSWGGRRSQWGASNGNRSDRPGQRGRFDRPGQRGRFDRPGHCRRSGKLGRCRCFLAWRCDQTGSIIWFRDGRGRLRRQVILQGIHARSQRGELIGYSFQFRLLSCEALFEGLRGRCALAQCSGLSPQNGYQRF